MILVPLQRYWTVQVHRKSPNHAQSSWLVILVSVNPICWADSRGTNSISIQSQQLVSNSQQDRFKSIQRRSKHRFGIQQVKKDIEPSHQHIIEALLVLFSSMISANTKHMRMFRGGSKNWETMPILILLSCWLETRAIWDISEQSQQKKLNNLPVSEKSGTQTRFDDEQVKTISHLLKLQLLMPATLSWHFKTSSQVSMRREQHYDRTDSS